MTESEYKEMLRPHTRAVRQLLTDFDFFIEDIGPINLFAVSSRLKEYESATRKARRLGMPIEELQDLAGMRIVVATRHEVDVVARFFYREQDSKDLELESDEQLSRETGYQARHIVSVVQPRYTRSVHPARVETQLMTVLQQAFNFMSRAWVYKSDSALSPKWQSRFRELAENLRNQNKLANALHTEVIQSDSTLTDTAQLTPLSYQRLVRKVFAEDISLDEAVDSCRMMVDIGCRTNGTVRSFFEDARVEQLRREFSTSPSSVATSWRDIVEKMPKHAFWLMFGTRYEVTLRLLSKGVAPETGNGT